MSARIGKWSYEETGPIMVAEIGINANGDFDLALEMLWAAVAVGAHVVKFQVHMTDEEMVRGGPTADYVDEPFDKLMDRVALSREALDRPKTQCEILNVEFMATPFSYAAADMLDEMGVVAFKTGSGELTNVPLLQYIARKGRPMVVSTGMSTLAEVTRSVLAICGAHPNAWDYNLVLMHCVSSYPTASGNMNLPRLKGLKGHSFPVGLSDHSPGIGVALAAVGLGAQVIEKHFTTDRTLPGPDQAASLEPDEFKMLVTEAHQAWQGLRDLGDGVQEAEVGVRAMASHSVVTTRAVLKGAILQAEDLTTKRPGTGIPAAELPSLIGSRVTRDVGVNEVLDWYDIDDS